MPGYIPKYAFKKLAQTNVYSLTRPKAINKT